MSQTLAVTVVSAEKEIFTGTGNMVVAPAAFGEVGVMPQHAPLLTLLQPGTVRVLLNDGEEELFYVSGGIMEVLPTQVTILSDVASRAEDIDEAAAEQARQEAEKILSEKQADYDQAQVIRDLARASAQLQTLRQMRKRKR